MKQHPELFWDLGTGKTKKKKKKQARRRKDHARLTWILSEREI